MRADIIDRCLSDLDNVGEVVYLSLGKKYLTSKWQRNFLKWKI